MPESKMNEPDTEAAKAPEQNKEENKLPEIVY
jgi:hypothetical protein